HGVWFRSDSPPRGVREPTSKDPSDAELAVLQVLWEQGPSTSRQLTDLLYPDGGESSYATVQKLLERLEEHGHVERDRSTHAHRFPARPGTATLGSRRP